MADFSSYTHKFRATATDSTHQNGAGKITKRNRQPVSCLPCRSKKLKCDRGHPCETCIKRGEEDACSYAGSLGNPTRPVVAKQDSHARRSKAQDRLQHLESLVMRMMNDPSNGLSRTATTASVPSTETTFESNNGTFSTDAQSREDGQGHFRVEGNEARYVGSTHWSAILDNINELKSVIVSEDVVGDSDEDERDVQDSDTLFGTGKPPSLERILQQHLPPRVQVDRRLSSYFNAKYLALPIIHTYQFQRQYEQFWIDPLGTPPLWVAIMFSIMCMSASLSQAIGSEPSSPEGSPTPRDSFLTAAAQCLTLGGYTRPKRFVLEALSLFTQCKYMATLDPSRESGLIFCIITRLAFRMGYHRDPDNFSHFTKFEGEMRRRMWAMGKQFDLMISFQLGLPSLIPPDSSDTKPPRNLLDADFDETTPDILPPSRPETEATQILYFVVKSRLMTIFGKICAHALAFHPRSSNADSEVAALHAEVHKAYTSIPEPLRIRSMAQSFADPGHLIMVRLNCEFLFRKSICVLHRKAMAQGSAFSRAACVESAVAILGHLIDLHNEFQPGGQLHADRWMLSSFTMNDFLLAAMVLCLALSMGQKATQSLSEYGVQEARAHLLLLRQAHGICLEMGVTSKEAKRVADALGVMLAKLEPSLGSGFASSASSTSSQQQQVPTVSNTYTPSSQDSLLLTPLSLKDSALQQVPPQPQQQQQPQIAMQSPPPPFVSSTGAYPLLDQFDNLLNSTTVDLVDWTAFDQYLNADYTFADAGLGVGTDAGPGSGADWTSEPYPFLGQLGGVNGDGGGAGGIENGVSRIWFPGAGRAALSGGGGVREGWERMAGRRR